MEEVIRINVRIPGEKSKTYYADKYSFDEWLDREKNFIYIIGERSFLSVKYEKPKKLILNGNFFIISDSVYIEIEDGNQIKEQKQG